MSNKINNNNENWSSDKTCWRKGGTKGGDLSLIENILAIITLFLFVGWIYILMLIIPLCFLYIYYNPNNIIFITCFILFLSLSYWPIDNQPWNTFLYSYILNLWNRYFYFTWKIKEQLDENKQYIFAEAPHSIVPLGNLLSVHHIRYAFPGSIICSLGASVLFRIPIYRHIYSWIGLRSAHKKNIHQILTIEKKSCALIYGGIAEMFLVSNKEERIFLKERKGFIKHALKEGKDIVPVFFFGNSLLLNLIGGSKKPTSYLAKLSRKLRTSLTFFYGRWFLPIPYRRPIKMVTGKILKIPHIENPTNEQINEYHNKFIEILKNLYYEERPEWEKRELIIT